MKKKVFLTLMALVAFAGAAQAATLVNGTFDELSSDYTGLVNGYALDAIPGSSWDVYASIPGWTTTNGEGIEIQKSTIVQAQSGDYYVELDSHPGPDSNSSMAQTGYVDAGDYVLSFFYQPRTNNGNDDNGIAVYFDDFLALEVSARTGDWDPAGWHEYTLPFTIDASGIHTLTFAAYGDENTYGGFLDTVSISGPTTPPVPEPASIALFGLGLLGVFARKRK